MARIFTEGAEAGDILFWTTVAGNSITNTTTNARIGGRCFVINNNTSGKRTLGASPSEFYIRFALQVASDTVTYKFAWFSGATELGSIRRNTSIQCLDIYTSTGTLQVSGTKPILKDTLYVIEAHIKIADAGGVIEFKIDGVTQTGFSGDTKPGAATTIDTIHFETTGTNVMYLDDMALNDTTGGADNSWCGDAHIYALTPNGNGNANQFTGSDGNSTDNYLLVDEIPSNSDTDYVQDATSGHKDLYTFTNLANIPAGASVVRVIVETRTREITAAGDAIKLGVRSAGTESFSSNIVVGVSYQAQKAEFLVDPATGVAWLQTAVDALEAGVQIP